MTRTLVAPEREGDLIGFVLANLESGQSFESPDLGADRSCLKVGLRADVLARSEAASHRTHPTTQRRQTCAELSIRPLPAYPPALLHRWPDTRVTPRRVAALVPDLSLWRRYRCRYLG